MGDRVVDLAQVVRADVESAQAGVLVESRGPFAQAAVALSVALAADGVDRQARAVERRPRELVEGVVRDVQPVEVRQLLGREILRQLAELVVGQVERGHRSRVFAGERPFGDFVDHVAAQDDVCDERSRRAETFGELRELVRREREPGIPPVHPPRGVGRPCRARGAAGRRPRKNRRMAR